MNENTNEQEEQEASASQSSGVKIVSRTGKELVVEVYGEASHGLDGVRDNEPAVLLDWNPSKVSSAVALANRDRPALPAWITDGYPITVRSFYYFQRFLLGFNRKFVLLQEERLTLALIQHLGGSGITIGRLLIPQNSQIQFACISQQLVYLMMGGDDFVSHICGPAECRPLAKVYVFVDEHRKKTAVVMPLLPLPKGLGVQAFEWMCCL